MTLKFKVQAYEDRQMIIRGFANSGIKVWVEIEESGTTFGDIYYVCIDEPRGDC